MPECTRCAETAGAIWNGLCARCHQKAAEREDLREKLLEFIGFLRDKGITLDKWKHCSQPGTRDVSGAMLSELIDEFMKEED